MNKVTGIILAGGKSTRMGTNKALLEFQNLPLFKFVYKRILSVVDNIIIVSNDILPDKYPELSVRKDIYTATGPLGGIYTGLYYSTTRYNFVIGCDMPFVNVEIIDYMKQYVNEYDITICEYNKRLEPLYAFYNKECLETIETLILEKRYKIIEILKYHSSKRISENIVRQFDQQGECFININNTKDYERYSKIKLK